MRHNITLSLLIILFLSACSTKYPIKEDKMTAILADIMIMESGNSVQYNYGLLPVNKWKSDYAFICKKHNTDTAKLRKTLLLYEAHPEKYARVMENVITRLQQQEIHKKVQKP